MEQALRRTRNGSQPRDGAGRRASRSYPRHRIPHVANSPRKSAHWLLVDRGFHIAVNTYKSLSRSFSANSRVTTKSQLGANRVQSTNSVKQPMLKKPNKNRKTAQARGLLNIALVPKGGIRNRSNYRGF